MKYIIKGSFCETISTNSPVWLVLSHITAETREVLK